MGLVAKNIYGLTLCAWIGAYAISGDVFAECILKRDVQINGPANCRDKPRGKTIKSISDREKVTVLERDGDWFQIQSASLTCWTAKTNLRITPADPVPSEKICGDSLSEEDNEVLDRASIPNPSLSEIIGYDGNPLSTPTIKPSPAPAR